MSMDEVSYPPMGDLVWDYEFTPETLGRLSGDMRLAADCGWHGNPEQAFQVAALWDSFRADLETIRSL